MEKKKYFFSLGLIFIVGALDAYCFKLHDGMFASMQTGNIIKVAIKLSNQDYDGIGKYFLTMFAFAVGIVVAFFISKIKRQEIICVGSALALYVAGILLTPVSIPISNLIMAFGVGLQLQAIRDINGFPVATTMCTGNLRSLCECIGKRVKTKDKKYSLGILIYSTLILSFSVGVLVGALIINAVA